MLIFSLHSFSGFRKSSVTKGENLEQCHHRGKAGGSLLPPPTSHKTKQWARLACLSRALSGVLILASRVPIRHHFPHFLVVGDKANNILQNSEHPRRQRGRKHEKEKFPREASRSTDRQWMITPEVSSTERQSRLFYQQPPHSISL